MKLRFRITLLTLLVGLIVLTISAVGAFSFYNSRVAAQELANQVLDQTSARIEQQVKRLLREATAPASLTARMIEDGQFTSADSPAIIRYGQGVMAVHPSVTSLFVGRSATGESVGLSRLSGNALSIWQTTPAADAPGKWALREFTPADYPDRPFHVDPTGGPDARPRPWFAAAKRVGGPVWTDSYVFLGIKDRPNVLGVTYATPVYRGADHALDSVVMTDFGLEELSQFLRKLKVGKNGLAFLIEVRDDGAKRLIAHPQATLAPRTPPTGPTTASTGPSVSGNRGRPLLQLEPAIDDQFKALLAQLPAAASPDDLRGEAEIRFAAGGKEFLGAYRRIEGQHVPRWVVCAVIPEDDVLAHAYHSSLMTFLIMLAASCIAIVASLLVSRQIARPLEMLAQEAAAVGHMRLEARPKIRSIVLEVDRLAAASAEMKSGLRSFQKYVPIELVRGLLDSGQEAKLGGERRVVSIFFSDIANFTTLAETMGSEALVAHLGDYFGAVSHEIAATGGEVDKFIGDSVMAFWGAPAANPKHASSAAVTAWRCQARLRERQAAWREAGRPAWQTRIGIHTGEVTVGNIGSAARLNYTVMGDAVNLASRLEGLNKYYGTEILISESTYAESNDAVVARPIDWVKVKGRSAAILVYELLGLAGETAPGAAEFGQRYARALGLYRQMQWGEAIASFTAALELRSADAPSAMMIDRCRRYAAAPPAADWDGSQRMDEK